MNRPLRVLNIEDSERDVELLRRHLSRAGYDLTIDRVDTAEEMKAALETAQWDVVLCDYSMPQFNALRALALVKEMELDIPFIIISGTVGEAVAVEAMRAGAHDYLMKDNLVRLGPTIEREMHEAENRRARRRAEAALRESEDRYRDLVEHSHDLICTHDLQGRILSINKEAARLLGYDSDILLGRNVREAILPDFRDAFDHYIAKLEEEGIASGVMNIETRTGEKRIWEYTNTLRTEGVPAPIVRGRAQDVTEQRRAESALKASEAELRALFEAMTDVILVLDAEGRYLKIAPTDPAFLYKPSDDLIGKKLDQVFAKHETDFFLDHIRRALDEGQMHRVEYRLQINQKEMWFDGSVAPMSKDSVLWIARDTTERKRAEQVKEQLTAQVEEQRQRLKNIIANVPGVVWETRGKPGDGTQRIDFISDYIGTMLGYDMDEWLAGPNFWRSIIHPDDRERAARESAARFAFGKGSSTIEFRWVAKDGHEVCVESRFAVVTDNEGRAAGLRGVITDITERKRAEEQLRESEERYRVVAETATDVIITIDENSNILFANGAVERVFGYAVSELLDKQLTMLMPEYLRHVHEAAIGNYVQTGRKHINWESVELPGLHRSGRKIPLEISFGEFTRNGRRFFTGIARDITERKRVEHELSKSEERYRDIVENAHDIIYSHDLQGNYTSINNAGVQISGYSREEALSMNLVQAVAPESLEKAREMIARKLAGETVTAYELEIVAKNGHHVAVEVNSKLVFQDGAPVGVQGIARDVTERKQLEEQFRQSQKMEGIGQLAGGIAHDFNNLLTAITGYSELSMKRLRAEDPLLSNLQEIKKAGDRAATLTRQLLAFSRKQVLQPKVLDLNAVVSDLEKMLRRLIGEDIELRTVLEPQVGSIKVDPGQIEQIIMNLAVNARDAMPQGGKLIIETKNIILDDEYARTHIAVTPGPFVMLAVSDSGTGIDPQTQSRMFEPFFTTKEVGKGTGLGLSTVYGIVKQSNGNIWVYSEVGVGTTFKIYLPRTDESLQVYKRESDPEEFLRGTETVLLAEDEDVVRKLACHVLRLYGYQVLEAADGNDALLICESHPAPIHLLITDVIMPAMSGRALASRVTELRPDMQVLYMSGYTDNAIVHHGVLDEGTNFIQKPFSTDVFAIRVREILNQRSEKKVVSDGKEA
jgi:two-component system, cell cycle sensor histidine kinase and response regulator CckA